MRRAARLLMTGSFFIALLVSPLWAQTPPEAPQKGLSAHERAPANPAWPGATPNSIPPTLPLPQPIAQDMQISVIYPSTEARRQARRLFKKIYNTPRVNEKEQIRDAWKRAFGCDVWHPYYVAKEIEDKICEKVSVRVFKMKGKPKFEKNTFLYVFKRTF